MKKQKQLKPLEVTWEWKRMRQMRKLGYSLYTNGVFKKDGQQNVTRELVLSVKPIYWYLFLAYLFIKGIRITYK